MKFAPIPNRDTSGCLAHLLGRTPRVFDPAAARALVAGRVVLITGAGGSIGGGLARALTPLGPASLVLLDQGEYALWRTGQEIAEIAPTLRHRAIVADMRDAPRLRRVLAETRPDLVLHAAALKHVPIVQDHPLEGLLTNAIGTRNLVDAARAAGCRAVVLVSTDKAVSPVSVMGATKRLAEIHGQATDIAAGARGEALRCVSLRLGNVIGSTGSVAQLFARQIAAGGPLTVTHPDMRRFFFTPDEAVGLLFSAARLAMDGALPPQSLPFGAVLVPEMGQPIRILDLARRMIRAAGLRPGQDVDIRFTAPRDGEKLAEQACDGAETPGPTRDPALGAVLPHAPDLALLARAFEELEAACRAGEERLALTLVSRLIPGFEDRLPGHADRMRA